MPTAVFLEGFVGHLLTPTILSALIEIASGAQSVATAVATGAQSVFSDVTSGGAGAASSKSPCHVPASKVRLMLTFIFLAQPSHPARLLCSPPLSAVPRALLPQHRVQQRALVPTVQSVS